MTPALAIVLLVVATLVTLIVLTARYMGREEQKRKAYLHDLASRLGVTLERDSPARLTGERDGRRYIVSATYGSGKQSQVSKTRIEVAVTTPMNAQIQPQTSDLGAAMAGDQYLDDPEFDAACFVQSTDLPRLRAALDPGMRALIAAQSRSNDLRSLVVHKQWVQIELRGGPDDPEHESRLRQFLELALTLASRLDAPAGV